jgi:hypothetical protein
MRCIYIFTWSYNLPNHDQSQIIDENKYTGLTVHFIKRRSIFMGRSQNAGFFFTWIYNLPYHDQSQIIDENKYTGLALYFIRDDQSSWGYSQNAVYCGTFAKCVVFIIVLAYFLPIDFKKQESCCLGYYFTYIKSIRLSYVFESVSTALFLGQSQKHHSQNDEQYANHPVYCDFLT